MFENCEVATLKPSMFKYMQILGITREYYSGCDKDCHEVTKCNYFTITIEKSGLDTVTNMGHIQCEKLIDRLERSKDITHIAIVFEDSSEEYITVPWSDGKHETINGLQEHIFNKKQLIITIQWKLNQIMK